MSSIGKTVVIADDHETLVMYLSILLHRMGFEVIPAKNGEEVMEILETVTPDVVITDRRMPIMDGLTTLKVIKNDTRFSHIPVIVMSAYYDEKIRSECINAGAEGFLPKPVKVNALNALLQECVTYENNIKRTNMRCSYGRNVIVEHESKSIEYHAVTLSEGGIYLRTQKPLPVGENVTIHLETDTGSAVVTQGTVIYQKAIYNEVFKIDPGMAVQFNSLSAQDSDKLNRLIMNILAGDLQDEQQEPVLDDVKTSINLNSRQAAILKSIMPTS